MLAIHQNSVWFPRGGAAVVDCLPCSGLFIFWEGAVRGSFSQGMLGTAFRELGLVLSPRYSA